MTFKHTFQYNNTYLTTAKVLPRHILNPLVVKERTDKQSRNVYVSNVALLHGQDEEAEETEAGLDVVDEVEAAAAVALNDG